jgi:hypothetical protein
VALPLALRPPFMSWLAPGHHRSSFGSPVLRRELPRSVHPWSERSRMVFICWSRMPVRPDSFSFGSHRVPREAGAAAATGLTMSLSCRSPRVRPFVACTDGSPSPWPPSPGAPLEPGEAAVEIVDPDENWVSTDLACGPLEDGWSFFSNGADLERQPNLRGPEAARVSVSGIRDSDVVEPAGYPGAKFDAGTVRVLRDGEIIEWMRQGPSRPFTFYGYACPGSGIG